MGREVVRAILTARLSRHNSDDDIIDDALWTAFLFCVERMSSRYPFDRLSIKMNPPAEPPLV